MINYIKLFSGHALTIIPEFTKDCEKDLAWHKYSDHIRENVSQDMIKSSCLIIVDSLKEYADSEDLDDTTVDFFLFLRCRKY